MNVKEALNAYNKSIYLDKSNSDSLYRAALLYKKNGNSNKATQIQKELLLIDEVKGLELENLL